MALLLTFAVINILSMPANVLLPLFVRKTHSGDAGMLAALMVELAIGSIG